MSYTLNYRPSAQALLDGLDAIIAIRMIGFLAGLKGPLPVTDMIASPKTFRLVFDAYVIVVEADDNAETLEILHIERGG